MHLMLNRHSWIAIFIKLKMAARKDKDLYCEITILISKRFSDKNGRQSHGKEIQLRFVLQKAKNMLHQQAVRLA